MVAELDVTDFTVSEPEVSELEVAEFTVSEPEVAEFIEASNYRTIEAWLLSLWSLYKDRKPVASKNK